MSDRIVERSEKELADLNTGFPEADTTEDSDSYTCPVCWVSFGEKDLVHGRCGHCLCLSCTERLLFSPCVPTRPDRYVTRLTVVSVTLNFCPICRKRLYIYDIKRQDTKEKVYKQSLTKVTLGKNLIVKTIVR